MSRNENGGVTLSTTLPTRRNILFKIGAGLAIPSAIADAESKTAKPHYPLLLSSHGSAEFDSILARAYPALAADPGFAALKPAAYIFQNGAPLSIRSLSVQWSVATGASVFSHSMHLELPARRRSVRTGQRMLMGPGGYLLVTPFFAWHPGAVPAAPIQWSTIISGNSTRKFVATELLGSKAFGLSFHGLIYENGQVVGGSSRSMAKKAVLTQAGEHDCALSIQKKLAKGLSLEEVERTLNYYIAWHPETPPASDERIYQASRRSHATVLLRAMKKHPGQFTKIVSETVAQKRLVLTT